MLHAPQTLRPRFQMENLKKNLAPQRIGCYNAFYMDPFVRKSVAFWYSDLQRPIAMWALSGHPDASVPDGISIERRHP